MVVLDPDSPFLTPAVRADLGKQLRALAARYTRLVLVPASSGMTLATLQKKAGCQDAEEGCLVAMARAAEVDRLVWSQVQKLPGRSLVVVAAVDGRAGRVVDGHRLCRRGADSHRHHELGGGTE